MELKLNNLWYYNPWLTDAVNIIIPKVWPLDHNTIGEGLSLFEGENAYLKRAQVSICEDIW